jgi:hypothetical protein
VAVAVAVAAVVLRLRVIGGVMAAEVLDVMARRRGQILTAARLALVHDTRLTATCILAAVWVALVAHLQAAALRQLVHLMSTTTTTAYSTRVVMALAARLVQVVRRVQMVIQSTVWQMLSMWALLQLW